MALSSKVHWADSGQHMVGVPGQSWGQVPRPWALLLHLAWSSNWQPFDHKPTFPPECKFTLPFYVQICYMSCILVIQTMTSIWVFWFQQMNNINSVIGLDVHFFCQIH